MYIDQTLRLISYNNHYLGNWALPEGSFSLATSFVIKNMIDLESGLRFEKDIFEGHMGVPTGVIDKLEAECWKENYVIPPIISIG